MVKMLSGRKYGMEEKSIEQPAEAANFDQESLSASNKRCEIAKFIGTVVLLLIFNIVIFGTIAVAFYVAIILVAASEHPSAAFLGWLLVVSVMWVALVAWGVVVAFWH